MDPSLTEEAVMEGRLVVGMNIHREICVLSMAGGVAIHQDQVRHNQWVPGRLCLFPAEER